VSAFSQNIESKFEKFNLRMFYWIYLNKYENRLIYRAAEFTSKIC
jgi:hypothetical protein